MRIGDILYFAPGLPFSAIDGSGKELPDQLRRRIDGFYLLPSIKLAEIGHGFASGLLCVCAIDALAGFRHGKKVGSRFKTWVREELPSFNDEDVAAQFYEDIRNGLVHEARLKNGAEFNLEGPQTVCTPMGLLQVNPRALVGEVNAALLRYIKLLENDGAENKRLRRTLKRLFEYELRGIQVDT